MECEENRVREWACLNGRLTPAEEARISVYDSGFMQGIGLFETMRTYGSQVFRLPQHLARLASSARQLGWAVIPEAEHLEEHVRQVVTAAGPGELRVRVTVTTGSLRATERETPELTVVATASPGARYPDEHYLQGVTVVAPGFVQGRRDPTIGHKTTSYFARLASLREAHARGAFEALWLTDDGGVAEAAISSLFLVNNGRLLTPPLDTPVLPGITRATVLELAAAQHVPVEETAVTLDALRAADEVFLTNSLMEIMPVVRFEREPIGHEKPGELTRALAVAYGEQVERECGRE